MPSASQSCTPCPPLSVSTCCSLPLGFSRLRYFFGKRLSAADFRDEQFYHTGKMRLHNHLAHGSGVLCGLGVEVFQLATPTVLRVVKGAAIDSCGREIVVGTDQCIDVDAWYQRELDLDPGFAEGLLDEDGFLPLCVTIEYTECATAPEPAPRDPCSCAEAGCDYGRTRESFVLRLMPEAQGRIAHPPDLLPSRDALAQALSRATGPASLRDELARAISGGCPEAPDESWLILSCFRAELATDGLSVVGIQDATVPWPLLSTGLLQELLLLNMANGAIPTAIGGPEISEVTFAQDTVVPTTYQLGLQLTAAMESATFDPGAFSLHRLQAGSGWSAPGAGVLVPTYQDAPSPRMVATIDNSSGFLVDGGQYRLHLASNAATPMVDVDMRPVLPHSFSWDFGLVDDAGVLTMVPPPYAG